MVLCLGCARCQRIAADLSANKHLPLITLFDAYCPFPLNEYAIPYLSGLNLRPDCFIPRQQSIEPGYQPPVSFKQFGQGIA
jgi:hypothetical protein